MTIVRWVWLALLLSLESVAGNHPYPSLQSQLAEGFAESPEPGDSATEFSEDPPEAAAERLQLRLFELFAKRDLAGVISAIKSQPAAFASLGEDQLVFLLPTLGYAFDERARVLEWGESRLLPLLARDEAVAAQDMATQLRLVDALLQRDIDMAGWLLRDRVAVLQSRCGSKVEDESPPGCEEGPLSDLSNAREMLQVFQQRSQAPQQSRLIQLPLTAEPLVLDYARFRCGFYGLESLFIGMAVDEINIAMAFGDLDGAIELALRKRELPLGMDSRLPDLLRSRYGETRLKRELARAEKHIAERSLPAGRVVLVTLFGHELRLPSRKIEPALATPESLGHPHAPEPTTVTEYTTLAEHQRNFRATELYRAVFDTQ